MDKSHVYSIASLIFTSNGEIVVTKNDAEEINIIPEFFYGNKELDAKPSFDDEIRVIKDDLEYKEQVAYYLGEHDPRYVPYAVKNGFFKGNPNSIMDCGTLSNAVHDSQITEMTILDEVSFIRVADGIYNSSDEFAEIINHVQIRFIVIPKKMKVEFFKGFEALSLEALIEGIYNKSINASERLEWFFTDDNLKLLEDFSESLKKINGIKR